MAKSTTRKQSFIPKADRPELKLKSDTPVSGLTIRDLVTILGQLGTRKDFWDGKDWQKDDFDVVIKWKDDKEFKEGKDIKDKEKEKDKDKEHKEKREIKELKIEKIESDGVFEPQPNGPGPDPRIDQVIRALSGMTAKVDQLADQVEALKKSRG
jgi:hypothetical protein